jgi:hypothetical protein
MAPQRNADERLAADLNDSPKVYFRSLENIFFVEVKHLERPSDKIVFMQTERGETG